MARTHISHEDKDKDAPADDAKTAAAKEAMAAQEAAPKGLTREMVNAMEDAKMASANPQQNPTGNVSLDAETAAKLGRPVGPVGGVADLTRPTVNSAPLHNPGVVLEPGQPDPSPNTTPDRLAGRRNPTDPSRQTDPPRQGINANMSARGHADGVGDGSSKPENQRDPSDPSRKADRESRAKGEETEEEKRVRKTAEAEKAHK